MTLRIDRSVRQRFTVFASPNIILDLRDVRLADREAVRFLTACEADGMTLENCPAYVREWIAREKD
jgi:hypothetical protein